MATSFVTPKTWSVGDVLTAADMNVYDRDNIAWLGTDKPGFRIYNSADEATTNATEKTLTFNSERFDNQAMHSTVTNTENVTIPAGMGGTYLFGLTVNFASNAIGRREILLYVNTVKVGRVQVVASAANETCLDITTLYQLVAGDVLTARTYQTSGGALNVSASVNYSPEFWGYWMGT